MRRISSVLVDATAYVGLAYILLRIPFALVYAGILAFAFLRVDSIWRRRCAMNDAGRTGR